MAWLTSLYLQQFSSHFEFGYHAGTFMLWSCTHSLHGQQQELLGAAGWGFLFGLGFFGVFLGVFVGYFGFGGGGVGCVVFWVFGGGGFLVWVLVWFCFVVFSEGSSLFPHCFNSHLLAWLGESDDFAVRFLSPEKVGARILSVVWGAQWKSSCQLGSFKADGSGFPLPCSGWQNTACECQ